MMGLKCNDRYSVLKFKAAVIFDFSILKPKPEAWEKQLCIATQHYHTLYLSGIS